MKKYKTIIILGICVCLALILHLLYQNLPCLNSDEAAFGYNAYSILHTGKDEYGVFLPTRLKSFGENKLPLMSYLQIPFIAVMGLNETSVRMIIYLIGIVSPILFYFLARELFEDKRVAYLAAFLSAVSPWIEMTSRHAYEGVLAYGLLLLSFIFILKYEKTLKLKFFSFFILVFTLSLFSHHIAKPFVFFFAGYIGYLFITKKKYIDLRLRTILITLFILPLLLFSITELANPTNRISNLFFTQNKGFVLSIEELRRENPNRLIRNKVTQAVIVLTHQYISYFSPDFLVIKGDDNPRFGMTEISPISLVEYIFLFIGLYYLFSKKHPHRYLLLSLLLISPLSASLAWQEHSLTRAFFMIVPLLLIAAYGGVEFILEFKNPRHRAIVLALIIIPYAFFTYMSWDFYFFHYLKKPLVIRAWECGYQELGSYIKENYHRFDSFVITRGNGQPYIYLLFYLRYDPAHYQSQARLTPPDKYGFGQIEKFDKFNFNFGFDSTKKRTSFIGFPEDFTEGDKQKAHKITIGSEDIFYIYETI